MVWDRDATDGKRFWIPAFAGMGGASAVFVFSVSGGVCHFVLSGLRLSSHFVLSGLRPYAHFVLSGLRASAHFVLLYGLWRRANVLAGEIPPAVSPC